jgi:hypothetical protein
MVIGILGQRRELVGRHTDHLVAKTLHVFRVIEP